MRQVVVASAGAGVGAFRVPWPSGTAVFELAHADVHNAAHATLKATGAKPPRGCSHRRVPRDPNVPAGLVPGHLEDSVGASGAPGVPSLWIVQDVGATDAERWEAMTEEMADLMCAGSEVVGHVPASMAGTAAEGDPARLWRTSRRSRGFERGVTRPLDADGFEETLGEGQLGVFHGVKQRPSKMEAEYYQEQVYLVEHEYGDEEGFELTARRRFDFHRIWRRASSLANLARRSIRTRSSRLFPVGVIAGVASGRLIRTRTDWIRARSPTHDRRRGSVTPPHGRRRFPNPAS